MSEDDDKKEAKTLLGRDLDTLILFVKRAAALGAVLGFIFHHCR